MLPKAFQIVRRPKSPSHLLPCRASGLVTRLTERVAGLAATRERFPGRNVAAVLAAFPKLGAHPEEAHLLALCGAARRALNTFAPGEEYSLSKL